jgi:diguanylate cyclase (GGDEF)-like protein
MVALLYLGLDRFKRINDSLGHSAGDELIRQVAGRLGAAVREADVVARLGGDEFVILLEHVGGPDGPARLARKLLDQVREPVELQGRRLHVTASIGISLFPADGGDVTTLLRNADAAMYIAKRAGRDGYTYFTTTMAQEAGRRLELEVELRRALEADELVLHYQPQVLLPSGRLLGVEALVRWEHPQRGLLGPREFLGMAQDAGLMRRLTERVLALACRQARAWRERGVPIPRIAVNLDSQVLSCGDLEHELLEQVRQAGIQTTDLELEVTETTVVQAEHHAPLWQRLTALGFELAVDDFGIGESSLARLKALPFTTLKVDGSFVRDIESDESDRVLIRAIVAMARSLGKRVLAEGVETQAQLRFLSQIGCDDVQGYYFSRPVPADPLAESVQQGQFEAETLRVLAEAGGVAALLARHQG